MQNTAVAKARTKTIIGQVREGAVASPVVFVEASRLLIDDHLVSGFSFTPTTMLKLNTNLKWSWRFCSACPERLITQYSKKSMNNFTKEYDNVVHVVRISDSEFGMNTMVMVLRIVHEVNTSPNWSFRQHRGNHVKRK